MGNERRRTTYRTADTVNNVQIVRIDSAEPGDYTVEVTAISELLFGPQNFAPAASCEACEPGGMWQRGHA